ncbi:hypothetical protein ACWDV4_03680 [Micromonospora sp. NPDC003197]
MDEFAANLRNDLVKNYIPHLQLISDDVSVELPPVNVNFGELYSFLTEHHASITETHGLVYDYQNITNRFAEAARKISENYANSDAFAAARVKDVEAILGPKPEHPARNPPESPAQPWETT